MKANMIAYALLLNAAGVFAPNEIAQADSPTSPPSALATKPDAKLCHAYVLQPATYRAKTEQVQVVEGSPVPTTTPAEISTGERIVKTVDGYTDYEIIPAKFTDQTETIEVERERVEVITTPATYRTVKKEVVLKPATQRWDPTCKPTKVTASSTPPTDCLIKVPAEYQTVEQQIVDIPAKTIKQIIPAKTQTITRRVLVEPAKIIVKPVSATYESIQLNYVSKPAAIKVESKPSSYTPIETQQELRPARLTPMLAWCEDRIDADAIRRLQQRLKQLNYYAGAEQGTLDTPTRNALVNFQVDNHLATGAITVETLTRLGLQ